MFDSKDSACKGIATSLFYENKVSPQLKALCEYCPIAEQCRDWALRHENFGYWGGTTEAQRIVERRERNITVQLPEISVEKQICGTDAGYMNHLRESRKHSAVGKVDCLRCKDAHRIKQRNLDDIRAANGKTRRPIKSR
jgi:hypothetical protein